MFGSDLTIFQPRRRFSPSRLRWLAALLFAVAALAQQGWYPTEGVLLKYRVNLFFGQEPPGAPDGFVLSRVSSITTDSDGNVYVFQRGKRADPIIVFDKEGRYVRSWTKGCSSILTMCVSIRRKIFGSQIISSNARRRATPL